MHQYISNIPTLPLFLSATLFLKIPQHQDRSLDSKTPRTHQVRNISPWSDLLIKFFFNELTVIYSITVMWKLISTQSFTNCVFTQIIHIISLDLAKIQHSNLKKTDFKTTKTSKHMFHSLFFAFIVTQNF